MPTWLPDLARYRPEEKPYARQQMGGQSTTVTFFNRLSNVRACVYAIDDQMTRQLYTTVPPGQSQLVSTFVGHPWQVEVTHQGQTSAFVCFPTPEDSQVVLDIDLLNLVDLTPIFATDVPNRTIAPKGTNATVIYFKNELQFPVKIFWVNFEMKAISYGMIHPGRVSRQPTYVGHAWEIVEDTEILPFTVFYGAPQEGRARIHNGLLKGQLAKRVE
ncbi:hypothetical protein H0H92_008550 [Tricholoma furcatifolium]|nr:hypothetical protein H0H92_008550 [Tricholoma furcatifolium]